MSAKKSFKNSPAMQFLSIQEEEAAPSVNTKEPPIVEETKEQEASEPTVAAASLKPQNSTPVQVDVDIEPKSTEAAPLQEALIQNEPPAPPMKRNPEYIETRSKRVQLLMQPSLHASLRTLAQQQELSVNDLIHQVMENYIKKQTL